MDCDRDDLDDNDSHMNDAENMDDAEHMEDDMETAEPGGTDDEVVDLRRRLADAYERIEQLEETLLHLSVDGPGPVPGEESGSGSGGPDDGSDGRSGSSNDRSLLLDHESKLFSEAYFDVALDARLAAAKRHLRPVSIALIEMTEGTGGGRTRIPPARGADAIRDTLRDADTACRLSGGMFALILEDTPENGAVWTVERIRRNLISRFGPHTMWAGVACYPAHAFSPAELLLQARAALSAAKDWNQDRIEVAIAE